VNDGASIWSRHYLPVTIANLTVVAIAAFDGLAIVAALPGITEDLGDVALLPWVITAYLATSAVAIIVAGPVIDALGARWTFRVTGLWFLVWSAIAAAAPSMPLLVAARALQGLGGGLVIAVALAAVGLAYPAELRPSAFAANSVVWGVLGFGGPALVGVLLTVGNWRWIFLVQLPITAAALAAGWRTLPDRNDGATRVRADRVGISLLTLLTLTSLVAVSAIVERVPVAVAAALGAVVSAIAYWRHSGRAAEPVLARRHVRREPLRWVHLTSGAILVAGLGTNNYLPLYVQTTRGRSEGFAAFSVVFLTIGWTLGSIVYSQLLSKQGEAKVIRMGAWLAVPSLVAVTAGFAGGWPLPILFASLAFVGLAIGLVSTAGLTLMQATSEQSEMGRVNSAHQFIRTLCITYGVAIGGAILLGVVGQRIGDVGVVQDVIAGEEVAVGPAAADAIGVGLTVTGLWSVLAAVGCVIAAQRLMGWVGRNAAATSVTA
jgi:MFS family permease